MSKHRPCRLWMDVGEAALLKNQESLMCQKGRKQISYVLMFTTHRDFVLPQCAALVLVSSFCILIFVEGKTG